ncbi:TPM domain-containing protein, partial [Streptococcus suis]
VGLKGVDNGAILFIAPNEPPGHRGPRVEVGYGLEPVLPDALSSVIINQDMMPKLNAGDIAGAMTACTDALIQQLRANPDEAKARTDAAIKQF